MVAHAGGYCRAYFKGFRGVTQGCPLSPTIFNVVVEAVVRHWIFLVEGDAGFKYRWGREVQHHAAFLYVDDGPVASTDPVYLQGAFDTLTGLLDSVGIQRNSVKTVGVIFSTCYTAGTQSEAAYERRRMGEGLTY